MSPFRVALTFDAEHPDRPAVAGTAEAILAALAGTGRPGHVLRPGSLGGDLPGDRPADRRGWAPGRQPLALPRPDAAPDRRRDRGRPGRRGRGDRRRSRGRPAALVPLPVRDRRRRPAGPRRGRDGRLPARRLARRGRRLGPGARRRDRGRRRRRRRDRARRRRGRAAPRLADRDRSTPSTPIVTRLADAGAEFCRIDELADVPAGVPDDAARPTAVGDPRGRRRQLEDGRRARGRGWPAPGRVRGPTTSHQQVGLAEGADRLATLVGEAGGWPASPVTAHRRTSPCMPSPAPTRPRMTAA